MEKESIETRLDRLDRYSKKSDESFETASLLLDRYIIEWNKVAAALQEIGEKELTKKALEKIEWRPFFRDLNSAYWAIKVIYEKSGRGENLSLTDKINYYEARYIVYSTIIN
ncbi:MAG: hypothetical protein Q8N63_08690, partial [Nanoarchaeota archaeon]|nr:hypothetical protein [Nanoarchaeota archaeon]